MDEFLQFMELKPVKLGGVIMVVMLLWLAYMSTVIVVAYIRAYFKRKKK